MESNLTVNNKHSQLLESIIFFCLVIVSFDISFSGSGHWLRIGSISLRMVFSLAAVMLSLPIAILKWREWIRSKLLFTVILLGIIIIFSTILGIKNDNNISNILSDFRGFAWFGLIMVFFASCNTRKRVLLIMFAIVLGSLLQSLLYNFINFNSVFKNTSLFNTFSFVDQKGFGSITYVENGLYRVFFRSNIYMIIGGLFILYLLLSGYIPKYLIALFPFLLFSLLITYTRSTYLALILAVVSFIILIVIKKNEYMPFLYKYIILAIIFTLIYVLGLQFVSKNEYIQFAIQRTFSTMPTFVERYIDILNPYIRDTIESDSIRSVTISELIELIKKSPVWGNGFGASIASRSNGLVEYFFLDLLAKTGMLGFFLYCLPFALISIRIIKRQYNDILLMITLYSGLIAFFVASFFNPYMNSSLGIAYYSFVISVDRLQLINT